MTILRLFAISFITLATAVAWWLLAGAIQLRTDAASFDTSSAVNLGWGPPIKQIHPEAWYSSPGGVGGKAYLRPSRSDISIDLKYEAKQKGLVWHRTYGADFRATYSFRNPTPISQMVFVRFQLPTGVDRDSQPSLREFSFHVDGRNSTIDLSKNRAVVEWVEIPAGESRSVEVKYQTRGVDEWTYTLSDVGRLTDFTLSMTTDFNEIDFPESSPLTRERTPDGWKLIWKAKDEIGASDMAMAMPNVLNPGPTAARISFFAPVSLLFFFGVLVVMATVWRVPIHPMNFFFLAAGCFAFQLLFAYLVDLLPIYLSFAIAAAVSIILVSGYLLLSFGRRFACLSAVAQLAFMVLFSYSFFFDGLTGLTITIGAIVTLAILMGTTAKVNWAERLTRKKHKQQPPPVPSTSH